MIVDFDACSLYPSSMGRLLLPTGKPQKITIPFEDVLSHLMDEQQIEKTNDKFISAFVVKIKITKINKARKMPIIILKDKQVNRYLNVNTTMMVDYIYFQDLIQYQEIEYEFIEGVMWVGNRDKSLSETIKKVYDIRKEMKRNNGCV